MMMTGSLKQAKHSASPGGLISRTDLPLIRLGPLSLYLFLSLSSFLPLPHNRRLLRPFFFFLIPAERFSVFPLATDGHLTGLLKPPSPVCPLEKSMASSLLSSSDTAHVLLTLSRGLN